MYLVYIEYSANYIETFNKTAGYIKYQFSQDRRNLIEKTGIRWVSMDTIINCIENKETIIPLRGVFFKTIQNSREELMFLNKN